MAGNNRKRLVELVKQEAGKLREFAKDSEKKKLVSERVFSRNQFNCIYGQLTGGCFSPRAHELLIQCAPRVYEVGRGPMEDAPLAPIDKSIKTAIKGREKSPQKSYYYSPIEIWLCKIQSPDKAEKTEKTQIKSLVDFIQGTTDTLDIS